MSIHKVILKPEWTRDGVSRFALIARVSASHVRLREREPAAGLK